MLSRVTNFFKLASDSKPLALPATAVRVEADRDGAVSPCPASTLEKSDFPIGFEDNHYDDGDGDSHESRQESYPSSEKEISTNNVCCDNDVVYIGAMFESLEKARKACVQFGQCPLKQQSTKKLKYVTFSCFRGGSYKKKNRKLQKIFKERKKAENVIARSSSVFVVNFRPKYVSMRSMKSQTNIIMNCSTKSSLLHCLKTDSYLKTFRRR